MTSIQQLRRAAWAIVGTAILVAGCCVPIQGQDKTLPQEPDPVVGKLPPRFLVTDRAFKLDVPPKGAKGEAASRFMLDLMMRSRAKLTNLTGDHTEFLAYTGRLTKNEWVPHQGKNLYQVADFKFRFNVFSARFDWIEGVNEGKVTVFVKRKKYDGKMYVSVPWVLWWVKIDPNDKRVYETSRRAITAAGLHNLTLGLLDEAWKIHKHRMYDVTHKGKRYCVEYLGVEKDPIEGRPKYKFKRTLPTQEWTVKDDAGNPVKGRDGKPVTLRFISPDVIAYFDVEWLVPTRVEVFDWEKHYAEEYSFTRLKWGVKFNKPGDKDFWEK